MSPRCMVYLCPAEGEQGTVFSIPLSYYTHALLCSSWCGFSTLLCSRWLAALLKVASVSSTEGFTVCEKLLLLWNACVFTHRHTQKQGIPGSVDTDVARRNLCHPDQQRSVLVPSVYRAALTSVSNTKDTGYCTHPRSQMFTPNPQEQ